MIILPFFIKILLCSISIFCMFRYLIYKDNIAFIIEMLIFIILLISKWGKKYE